ncbi:unnamed protein product [Rotaria socialis]|uniref:Uncharacterized protein n=1 Tax=Rotaria socialis TaxID=392032 RepID=A0A820XGE5_9BILA|nr:unnamed protein product [Rotaria socialis]
MVKRSTFVSSFSRAMITSFRWHTFRLQTCAFRCAGTQSGMSPLIKTSSNEDKNTTTQTLPSLNFVSNINITENSLSKILSNFKESKAYYRQKVLEGNHEVFGIYTENSAVQDTFQKFFPELVQSRGITQLQQLDREGKLFERWNEGNNEHVFADRFDSNYDGSAYYYHQRDAAPIYINRVNRGPYCVYIDLHKRFISPIKLAHHAETDRNHVKISLNWENIKMRYIFTIFIPNFWHMVTDLWIKNKKKSKIAHVIQHACRSVPIVHAISASTGLPVETMLIHGENKANYVGFAGSTTDPKSHFTWLNKFADIPFEEISREGFGSEVVQVLNFPNDGLVAPMIIGTLQKQLTERAKLNEPELDKSISSGGFKLTKLLVRPISSGSSTHLRVVRAEWIDIVTGHTHSTAADRLFISLGPSGQFKIVSPKITWMQHAFDVLRGSSQRPSNVIGGYTPTLLSFWRHTLNSISNTFFRGVYCCKDFISASGSSSVLLLGVDLSEVNAAKLDVLSRFVDGVNQHWTLIAQRDVSLLQTNEPNSPTKTYRFFAIQMTGGGNFPSRFIRPDYMLNLLYTTEKMYGLDVMKNAVYDIVQSRGCGRAVSAQNTIRFSNLADNAVINYALGGIGMSTMFSNGEKMVQMIEEQDSMLRKTDKQSNVNEHFLEGIDYSFMVDEKQHLARSLGFDDSMSHKEKRVLTRLAYTIVLTLAITLWANRKKVHSEKRI